MPRKEDAVRAATILVCNDRNFRFSKECDYPRCIAHSWLRCDDTKQAVRALKKAGYLKEPKSHG